ncbi:hypothetical protein PF005_g21845 [Phytophthora fragariae]|uniref:3'-5' exonuclease domain-containing protein n=1 Tax=Phytophthora fragariae TaxID=53985 RepID=A0A6A3WF60_9STRA|nr:hypothetical protein PF009_g26632 [Phytophthora fragariae]KAE8974888.1 hypothetical protein PF011_g24689 [Phytophthora fragariae]KAE9067220.1 hypothetical protein PF010_g27553 [Phytophthora fragariae]KAE9076661.1 hypothetical protein PF007_g24544 [Phytophthora fragariae]KAE9089684.1 hypothetical protein PF006_g25307 [Phytophthora fragariae]
MATNLNRFRYNGQPPSTNETSPQYVIDQARVPIHFVATKKDFSYCAGRLLSAQLMGFDTETRPNFGRTRGPNPCALLQIAVRDTSHKEEVFVIDLRRLPATVYNSTLTSVFLSKKIVKFGQSFFQDLQELAQSYPQASCFTVCKSVVEVNDLSIALTGAHNPLSLQKLVFFYLHRKLAKTQQMSNWERRPLTASQLHYAAADALVLIHLYDELLKRMNKEQQGEKRFQLSDVTNVLDVNLPRTPKCALCFEVFETALELKKHRKICDVDVHILVICAVCEGKKLVTEKAMEQHVKHCGVDEETAEPVVHVKRMRSLLMESRGSSSKLQQPSSGKKRRLGASDSADSTIKAAAETNIAVSNADTARQTAKRRRRALKKARIREEKTAKLEAAESKSKTEGERVGATNAAGAHQDEKERRTTRSVKTRKKKTIQKAASETAPQKTEPPSCRDQAYKKRKMSMESSLLASDAMWSQISSDCSTSSA